MSPILDVKNLHFSYQNEEVLSKINLQIEAGDYLMILGPNGGGKSTFLKLLMGLLSPTLGEVRFMGRPPREIVTKVGYLSQQVNINPTFPISVLDVVLLGGLTSKRKRFGYKKQLHDLAMEALDKVGMTSLVSRRIGELSGGQRQKVLIARALMAQPELLILDEPGASVDPVGRSGLYNLLKELNQSITVIMVSHDISFIPSAVKSIACVNRSLHFHPVPEITQEMMHMMYGHDEEGNCPVEFVAHGAKHRLLEPHLNNESESHLNNESESHLNNESKSHLNR